MSGKRRQRTAETKNARTIFQTKYAKPKRVSNPSQRGARRVSAPTHSWLTCDWHLHVKKESRGSFFHLWYNFEKWSCEKESKEEFPIFGKSPEGSDFKPQTSTGVNSRKKVFTFQTSWKHCCKRALSHVVDMFGSHPFQRRTSLPSKSGVVTKLA